MITIKPSKSWGGRADTPEATVVAQRALGVVAGLPEGETLARLLDLNS